MNVLIHALLTPQERRRGLLVLLIAIAMGVVDTLDVASIMPFLAVLGNPGIVETNAYLAALYSLGGFASRDDFLFALGLTALAILLAAAVIRGVGQYAIFSVFKHAALCHQPAPDEGLSQPALRLSSEPQHR